MSLSVKKIILTPQQTQDEEQALNYTQAHPTMLNSIEVQCSVRIGTLTMTVAELKQLKSGQALSLQQKTNDPIELILNDQIIAKGELMCMDDHFAIQITEVSV